MKSLRLCLGWLILLSVVSQFEGVTAEEDGRRVAVVETRQGKVAGLWSGHSRSGRSYLEFKGIPYAKPPTGTRRLQAPEAGDSWNGTKEAFEYGPICIQTVPYIGSGPIHGQEDCLYLNVFTHNVSRKVPVIVHIHGGGFFWGKGHWHNPKYVMEEDVVVVNFNYRLGLWGFLTWETEELRGNQGLKDQVLALKWVQENIAAFGGDPQLVTINGDSAGSASVYFHTVSPLSKGLFHRGIAQSGTSYAPWALFTPGAARSKANRLMQALGCPLTIKEAITCVMGLDAMELANKAFNNTFQDNQLALFVPSLEPAGREAFLTGPLSAWAHSPVPLLLGTTSAEGLFLSMELLNSGSADLKWFSGWFDRKGPDALLYRDSATNPDHVTKQIKEYYFPQKDISINDWINITTVFSDIFFTVPIIEGAAKHNGDVYFLYFDYILYNLPIERKLIFGANHCVDDTFIWDISEMLDVLGQNTTFTERELDLSKRMVKLLVKFAKEGTPSGLPETWRKWTEADQYYVEVDRSGEFRLKKGLAEDRINFWKCLDYRTNYFRTVEENLLGTCEASDEKCPQIIN